MNKLIAVLGAVAVLAPQFQSVADSLGPKVSTGVTVGGAAALATTKALLDVQASLAARREQKARRDAALR